MKYTRSKFIIGFSLILLVMSLAGCNSTELPPATSLDLPNIYPPASYAPNNTSPFQAHLNQAISQNSHAAYLLETGDDALLARIHLIQQAKHSIDVQTFIWAGDSTGGFFFHELWQAAKRGVKVRLLIDDLSLRGISDYVAYLATLHPNIVIKHYNPLVENINASLLDLIKGYGFNFQQANRRMHNKVMIVDGIFGITGGRNYADDYFDRGIDRSFKDRDILISGKAVSDMSNSFEAYWLYELSVPSLDMADIERRVETNTIAIPDIEIQNYQAPMGFTALLKCALSNICMEERIVRFGRIIEHIEFIADPPGKFAAGDEFAKTSRRIAGSILNAKHSVIMQTPYLVIDDYGTELFSSIHKNNADLKVIVSSNSLASADHFAAYAYSFENKKKYLKQFNWQIHELKPSPSDLSAMVPTIDGIVRSASHYTSIHAKTYIVDDETVWIGSFNLDPRSITLNTEASLLIEDNLLASQVKQLIYNATAPKNSWTIGARERTPILGAISGLLESVFKRIPFFNVWPFHYATSFELNPGARHVPFSHQDFHNNYHAVGQFPGTGLSAKGVKARITKAFFGPWEPLI
jgi:putative cardiolipin synthase